MTDTRQPTTSTTPTTPTPPKPVSYEIPKTIGKAVWGLLHERKR